MRWNVIFKWLSKNMDKLSLEYKKLYIMTHWYKKLYNFTIKFCFLNTQYIIYNLKVLKTFLFNYFCLFPEFFIDKIYYPE